MLNTNIADFPRSVWTRFRDVFAARLRNQIVLPYLLLATGLAVIGTNLVMNAASQSLHQRFDAQLQDAARGGLDSLAQIEIQQLAGLRSMVYTEGFSDAVAQRDSTDAARIVAPNAINAGFDRVILVTADLQEIINLPEPASGGPALSSMTDELRAIFDKTLNVTGSFDKVSAIIESPVDGTQIFCTASPVRQNGQIIGAMLVGTVMPRLLRHVARDSLSDGANLYGPTGVFLGSALVDSNQSVPGNLALPNGWYEEIRANPKGPLHFRTLTVGDETYVEALGVIPGRGVRDDGTPGIFGVMLRTRTLDAKLQQTVWALVPLFGLALLLVIAVGRLLAAWIDLPLSQLVNASNYVAQGNFEVQVRTTRRDELGVLATRFNYMVQGLRQLLYVKDLFGRFVSPEVSEKLIAGQIELGGEQRVVTALFSDLRDFTRLSEEHPPQEIVQMLNEYFGSIVRIVRKHGGIVNKFGGDSTLVIFGAPLVMEDHADRALATALEMRDALANLNERRASLGWGELRQGIGINTGMAVAGQLGSEERMEYTVIGGAVNMASRLQSLTKSIPGCDIIFSENTLEALILDNSWEIEGKGLVQVRGRKEPMRVYSLISANQLSGKSDITNTSDKMLDRGFGSLALSGSNER